MDTVVSAPSHRTDRMSPWAVGLAVLLHGLMGVALWWMWTDRRQLLEDPVEITFEQVRPPEPPPPPPERVAQPPLLAPPIEGLRPPAPLTSDKPTQVPPAGERSNDRPAPPPPPLQEAHPSPAPLPPALQEALPAPTQLPPPPTPQEQALAAPRPEKPQPQPPSPPPQLRPPEHRPSPLTTAPPRRPPAGPRSDDPSPSPLVNPADVYNRARLTDNYLWQVVRKLQGYRYDAPGNASEGTTVVRVVIARDGRLLNVEVARSSGYPEFDKGVIAGVRAGSPYAPLPPEIRGDSATFNLPLVSIRRR